MKKIWGLFLLSCIISSCAFHRGNVSSGVIIDCPLKTIVTGQAHTSRILGLGGLNKNALILEAKQDLYRKYANRKNFKLTNFSVDFKTTIILIYSSTLVTVSADLYDCGGDTITDLSEATRNDGILPEDSIIYEHNGFYKGIVNHHLSSDRYAITFRYNNKSVKKQKVSENVIYKISEHPDNKRYFGYTIGEDALIEVLSLKTDTKTIKPCKIIGLNKTRLLVSYIKEGGQERTLSVSKSSLISK